MKFPPFDQFCPVQPSSLSAMFDNTDTITVLDGRIEVFAVHVGEYRAM
ncbi:hypothetical protein [Propionibacterium cyclohexanicum]|nr:hypothetical protein [Propionibacterium cyclohexanicum]